LSHPSLFGRGRNAIFVARGEFNAKRPSLSQSFPPRHQFVKLWLKEVAFSNMLEISVTFDVSQYEMEELKADAPVNI
jgi:hypothetical protein